MNKVIFTLLLTVFCNILNAQIDRDFWFAIPKEHNAHCYNTLNATNNVSFKIAAMKLDANVTISMPANGGNFTTRSFLVPAGTSHIEVMAINWVQFDSIYANPSRSDAAPLSGKTNHGIHITSDNDITVYYDYDNYWNRDLFSLKGKNALGTDFWTPFQYIWKNDNRAATSCGDYPFPDHPWYAYSYIDIVATEPGTTTVFITNNTAGVTFLGYTSPFSITLTQGQTFSLRTSGQTAAGHPRGTHITSTQKIAITINDDSVNAANGACADVIGDQLIPVNMMGCRYLIMCGDDGRQDNTSAAQDINRGEQIFVTATQANTTVIFKDTAGIILLIQVLGAGGSTYLSPNIAKAAQSSIYIESSPGKPIAVFHITGHACEVGGAIVPAITNCSGSNEVTVLPSITGVANGSDTWITMNIMVPYDTMKAFTDPSQSFNFFILYNAKYPSGYAIPGSWFESNRRTGWALLKMSNREWGQAGTGKNILVLGANKVVNTVDFFHLGMSNGTPGNTNKYGYFSSFSSVSPEVRISHNETQDYIGCSGATPTLIASGGIAYLWHYGTTKGAPTYLSDPTSATPTAIGLPEGSHNFYCDIHNPRCFGTDTFKVNVVILPTVDASFSAERYTVCSGTSLLFTNNAKNANTYEWTKKIDNGVEQPFIPSDNINFTEVIYNTTDLPIVVTYKLLAINNQGCNDTTTQSITVLSKDYVLPTSVKINSISTQDYIGCFGKEVSLEAAGGTDYLWHYGSLSGPSTYLNDASLATPIVSGIPSGSNNFYVDISNGSCSATLKVNLNILPQVAASFNTDKTAICAIGNLYFENTSQNANTYRWTKQLDEGLEQSFVPGSAPKFSDVMENESINNINVKYKLIALSDQGCKDSVSQMITVYPHTKAEFENDADNGHSPLTVTFTNRCSNASIFKWNFGDQQISEFADPVHEFINNQLKDSAYQVSLIAQYGNCSDTAKTTIVVLPEISSGFEPVRSENMVKLFPNPAKDILNVQCSLNKLSDILIEVLDPSGKLLNKITKYQQPSGINTFVIKIGSYPSSLLIMRITIDNKSIEFKVIKK